MNFIHISQKFISQQYQIFNTIHLTLRRWIASFLRLLWGFSMKSLGRLLDEKNGIGPGFDFLRIFLAFCIATFHAVSLVKGKDSVLEGPFWFIEFAAVPMFFALSGFLITASGMRLSLKNFLLNRSLRIFPALSVDICLCALIIGPIFSVLALKDYIRSPLFYAYFLNIVGYIHFTLPGVFKNSPIDWVNGSLWTIPYEILCYALISFFIIFGWIRKRFIVLAFTVSIILVGAFFEFTNCYATWPDIIILFIKAGIIGRKCQIVSTFLFGIAFYQLRYMIPYSRNLFFACLVISILTAFIFDVRLTSEMVIGRLILLPILTYMTVFIGLTDVPIPEFFKRGDYSYGVYLYHFPILQTIINLWPRLFINTSYGPLLLIGLGLPAAMLFAMFSWHTIEKPILALRKRFSFIARQRNV